MLISRYVRSTRGASKQRRDLINAEIKNLRDLLPLPDSVKTRLSYLHIMSLACVYTRKSNFFSQEEFSIGQSDGVTQRQISPLTDVQFDFTPAINGFIIVSNCQGKLLYISENVTEYLGHSMIDLLTQGGSVFDVIDERDHDIVRSQIRLYENTATGQTERAFFCRMNTSRSMRRQDNCSDNKVVHIRGRFHTSVPGSSWNPAPVFIGVCSPVSGTAKRMNDSAIFDTMVFMSHHTMDMKLQSASSSVFFHLGYTAEELYATSWYNLLYGEDDITGRTHHDYLIQQVQQGRQNSCEFVVRMKHKDGTTVNVCINASSRPDLADTPIICENRVISDNEMYYYKILQQNMVTESFSMSAINHHVFPIQSTNVQSSEIWPIDVPAEHNQHDFFPSVSDDNIAETGNSHYLTTPPPNLQETSQTPSPGATFSALKEATMELVRKRLKRRLSEQSSEEPLFKSCRFNETDEDDQRYDVKISTYSFPVASPFGSRFSRIENSNSSCMYPSGPSSTLNNLTGNMASIDGVQMISRLNEHFAPPPTPVTPSNCANSLDVMSSRAAPHLVLNNISLKSEISIPDSLLTPDPSPTIDTTGGSSITPRVQSRFTYNFSGAALEKDAQPRSLYDMDSAKQSVPDEEKTLSEEDLNTLRELAASLLNQTKSNQIKDSSKNVKRENLEEDVKHNIKCFGKLTGTGSREKDHCVPSEYSRVRDSETLQDSSLFSDQSPIYAHDSPLSTSSVGDAACLPSPTSVTSSPSSSSSAAGQPGTPSHNLESAEQLQLNLLINDQESITSEQSYSDQSDASSFIDELESYDMELISNPCNTSPSHGDLEFYELNTNADVSPFH
ncbi:neuronal PAS domain-containing protein 4-like isoform X2 [Ptychodera flava]|uniref:neuronal PAS domain-containing protein 4-like isoform X2 n=1 Tax=Ptychodera flava TaxID=63121 RepID=UPI00396A4900